MADWLSSENAGLVPDPAPAAQAASSAPERFRGGIAAADVDDDGDIDVYMVGGGSGANRLYRNQGDGTFAEVAADVGLAVAHRGSGPAFGDIDGDGDLDLFVGAVEGDPVFLFENRLAEADGAFVDVTAASGLQLQSPHTLSATFHDYDGDGLLDLFLAHWDSQGGETLWRNRGDGTFANASAETGIAPRGADWSFTPNLADLDGDGDGDLLLTADFGTSRVFRNDGDGAFAEITDRSVIVDQWGRGGAVGDFDNDGDPDWFVSSVYNLDVAGGAWFGNRLYRNDGAGRFEDATPGSNLADGGWGWAACAADFDNDGWLDIAQVNGWTSAPGKDYGNDRMRLFHNRGASGMTFRDRAAEAGLDDTGQGRGLICFDADRDGDLDMMVHNNDADQPIYYRNDTDNGNRAIAVRLQGIGTNRHGIGARVAVAVGDSVRIRELGGHSHYASHDPFEIHVGIGAATAAEVRVRWPDATTTEAGSVAAGRMAVLHRTPLANLRLSVVQGDGDGFYAAGDEIAIRAAPPEENYFFSHWSSSRGGTFADAYSAETTFTMPANPVALTARYTPGVALADDVSVVRRWNEVLLQAIRGDFARPTVHARNLFHLSAAIYDAWAAYAPPASATPWLLRMDADAALSSSIPDECALAPFEAPDDIEAARREALSFAAYRIVRHRFARSPRAARIARDAFALMDALGFDVEDESAAYATGSAAALGNRIAACYVAFGLADGANEANDYVNVAYRSVNPPLRPELPGNPGLVDPNRWQPLQLARFIDQAGNPIDAAPEFLSPEWGAVAPFALSASDRVRYRRDGFSYWVYHDPGPPPAIDGALAADYKWAHALVAVWSSHLSPDDGVVIDISPASIGNLDAYPSSVADYPAFYDALAAFETGGGHSFNPATGQAYAPQRVPRGDYVRVLAEFWADGPDSETPPGHWFTILNEVADHPLLERSFGGAGAELGLLEWDAKAYFALGGAMHDAAIAAWGIKGWYDYIRPISSLRAMADRGQSTDADAPSYHIDGIPLVDGTIELVAADDPLAGEGGEHVGKIKFLAWRGPAFIDEPATDQAGVGWILAENWWPYQRPTFVTPPFAGYVSGHSTYSRAAAEVLTRLTGDPFFPGGMSDFEIEANEFLVFEEGPSVDLTLQWATYRDAADQCSLSRIWGGIHPPVDDIPGRRIGLEVGKDAFALAEAHFQGAVP